LSKKESVGLNRADRKLGRRLQIIFTRPAGGHGKETFCEASMGFIVQSISKRPGEPPYRVTKATRKDALEAAIGFLGQGMGDVSIVDEKGRVFSVHEFSLDDNG
jgi:hypothetical protein